MGARRPEMDWVDGHNRLRVTQQYPGMPQHGLVFHVEQRTTLAGRAVLMAPARVAEIHRWLGDWLAAISPGPPAGTTATRGEHKGICGECDRGLIAVPYCTCGGGASTGIPGSPHEPLCGFEPCPDGCWERLHPPAGEDPGGDGDT